MNIQIAVFGNDEDGHEVIQQSNLKLAEELGREMARKNIVVLCGGRGGIMKAVAKGATEEDGIVVGILPSHSKNEANEYVQVVIPTGLGMVMRGSIIVRAADAVITIGGGVGTLAEIASAYAHKKPIIGLKDTGGWTDKLIDSYIDDRRFVKILGASSPKEAIDLAIKQVETIQKVST